MSIGKTLLALVLTALACTTGGGAMADGAGGFEKVKLMSGLPAVWHWPSNQDKPASIVLCLHELGMHAGNFKDMGERLSQKGMAVYSMDLRGFGGWKGFPGKNPMSIPKSLKDVKDVASALKEKYPGVKLFLLGEAMGGALALEAQSRYPHLVDGTISSCPGAEHFGTVGNYSRVGSHFITGANKDFGMAKDLITQATPRPEVRNYLLNDPDVRLDLNARELMSCQFYMYKTRRFAREIKESPVLIVQGWRDGESKPAGSERVYKSLATRDKKFMKVEEGDHYVYQDRKVDDRAFNETVSWIAEHNI